MKVVNICEISYRIRETPLESDSGCLRYGDVDYGKAEIRINKDMNDAVKDETLCHEIIHAILKHLGYTESACDEQFVQALGNAIYQTFTPKTRLVIPDEKE